jgi:hypothetical protein
MLSSVTTLFPFRRHTVFTPIIVLIRYSYSGVSTPVIVVYPLQLQCCVYSSYSCVSTPVTVVCPLQLQLCVYSSYSSVSTPVIVVYPLQLQCCVYSNYSFISVIITYCICLHLYILNCCAITSFFKQTYFLSLQTAPPRGVLLT